MVTVRGRNSAVHCCMLYVAVWRITTEGILENFIAPGASLRLRMRGSDSIRDVVFQVSENSVFSSLLATVVTGIQGSSGESEAALISMKSGNRREMSMLAVVGRKEFYVLPPSRVPDIPSSTGRVLVAVATDSIEERLTRVWTLSQLSMDTVRCTVPIQD